MSTIGSCRPIIPLTALGQAIASNRACRTRQFARLLPSHSKEHSSWRSPTKRLFMEISRRLAAKRWIAPVKTDRHTHPPTRSKSARDSHATGKHGRRDLNPQPADLESAALPIELRPSRAIGHFAARPVTLVRSVRGRTPISSNRYFFRDSLWIVCRRSFGQYFLSSKRSVPRVSF